MSEARWDAVLRADAEPEQAGVGFRIIQGVVPDAPPKKASPSEQRYAGVRKLHEVAGTPPPGPAGAGLVPRRAAAGAAPGGICKRAFASGAKKARGRRGYTVWSSDFHTGPIGDLKKVWGGVKVHGRRVRVKDMSLSGDCARAGTCAGAGLRVLNSTNGQDLGADPSALKRRFFEEYAGEMESEIDAFVCSHPAAMCELFEPFGKPLIVFATTRFEMARCYTDTSPSGCAGEPGAWLAWRDAVSRWGGSSRHVIAANSDYDAAYIHHFTGVSTTSVPSVCWAGPLYLPSR